MLGYGAEEEGGGGDGGKKEQEEDRLSSQSVRVPRHVLGHSVLRMSARLVRSLTIVVAGSPPT